MSKLSKKIRSLLPLSVFSLFFLFFILPTSLKASNCLVTFKTSNTSSIINKEIEEEIQSYLMSNSCFPVLTNSDIQLEITRIFEESGIIYIFGDLSQEENCLITLFSIEKGWFWTTTNMLYMTTDIPQTPLLFRDICSLAQAALPNGLSNYHVLIQKLKIPKPPNGGSLQTWAFYNLGEWIELIVLTIPTSDGGTDFAVIRPTQ